MGKLSQTLAREQAFILIFESIFNTDATSDDIVDLALECEYIEKNDYTFSLFKKVYDNSDVIDEFISKYLKGWTIDRISKASLAVLRLTLCEMLYFNEIPLAVSANEGINLCKKYGADADYSFVNGIFRQVIDEIKQSDDRRK